MADSTQDTHLLTIDELAKRSNLSVPTLRRYRRKGLIEAIQPGGPGCKLLFRPDAVEKARQVVQAEPVPPSGPSRLSGRRPEWMAPASDK